MNLTPEQQAFLRHDNNAILIACPGSGKTRVIIAKLMRCIAQCHETSRKIACITYTNAGVHEIENRVHQYGIANLDDIAEVSTIHSFCMNNILRSFSWMLPEYAQGLKVLDTDSEEYQDVVTIISQRYGIANRDRECFSQLNRSANGQALTPTALNADIAYEFWEELRVRRRIDYCNIVYLSYLLLERHPFISRGLSSRFAWILVDEFQDTSELQVKLFELIASCATTKFALVGDPYQSIFKFAGARTELMTSFANTIGASSNFHLTGNYRSSSRIIAKAEAVFPREPPMHAVGLNRDLNIEVSCHRPDNKFRAITEYFIPMLLEHDIGYGEAAILAPNWFILFSLAGRLREFGLPIVGPGARPYRRSNPFAQLAEHLCSYAEEPLPTKIRGVTRELFNFLLQTTGDSNLEIYGYHGRHVVIELLNAAIALRNQCEQAVFWLNEAATKFSSILLREKYLPASLSRVLPDSADAMVRDMTRSGVDLENLSVADLGVFANPRNSVKLLSLHAAKGREFDAVAIIGLHEGQLPHWSATTHEAIEEDRRKLYVGMTRPRKLLMLFPDRERQDSIPSRFLNDASISFSS